MRALTLTVLFALLLRPVENVKVEVELEDFSGLVEIPQTLLFLPGIRAFISDERFKILKLISQGINDVKSIAERIHKDESTVRRHISALKDLGLIDIEKKKPLKVKVTELADLIIEQKF